MLELALVDEDEEAAAVLKQDVSDPVTVTAPDHASLVPSSRATIIDSPAGIVMLTVQLKEPPVIPPIWYNSSPHGVSP